MFRRVRMGRVAPVLVGALASGLALAHAHAQVPGMGRTVEVIGLHRWTLQMIEDSLAVHAPGTPLARSQNALITKLHFGAVAGYLYSSAPGRWWDAQVLVVVEPQDSLLARRTALPPDSEPDRPEWREALAPFSPSAIGRSGAEVDGSLFVNSVGAYGEYAAGAVDSARHAVVGAASPDAAEQLWRWLAGHTGEADRQLALATLVRDRNWHNRLVAAAILVNFPERDSTWWALTDALMDRADPVTGAAAASLTTMAERHPRRVDWRPVALRLNHLLAGANPWWLPPVMRMLVKTQVDPALAAVLLSPTPPGDARQTILDCLGSNDEAFRVPARALLTRLRGADLGPEPAAWAVWLRSLPPIP